MAGRGNFWSRQQQKDAYVKQAQKSSYRSRAVYKLMEIDQRDKLLRPRLRIVDLGAAPGSWSQYAQERVGRRGRVIAVDRIAMRPIPGVTRITGDLTETETLNRCMQIVEAGKIDLVICDMAPNLTGIRDIDQSNSMLLAELALDFVDRCLKPGGDFLIKVFQGSGIDDYRAALGTRFAIVRIRKPRASKPPSREFYILGRGYIV